jgi:hypothetical protein
MAVRKNRVEIRLSDAELQQLERLMELSGLHTQTAAIRYAVKQALRSLAAVEPSEPPVASSVTIPGEGRSVRVNRRR